MELHGPSCKYLSNDNLAVPDVQWPVFAGFPRVKLILPKKSTFLQIMSRTKAALNGHRAAKNSATNSESSKADASGRVPVSLCNAPCLSVCLLLVTSISGQQRSTPPWFTPWLHSLSEARERECGLEIFAPSCDLWRQLHSRYLWRRADAPDLGRMSLITELMEHKNSSPDSWVLPCSLLSFQRVLLHVLLIFS